MAHRPLYTRAGPRYWHARFWLVVAVLAQLVAIRQEPQSYAHKLIERTDGGWYWVGLLAGVALWGVADVVVNDMLPDGITLPGERRRYLAYLAICMGLVSLCGVLLSDGWTPIVLSYAALAGWSLHVAFSEMLHFHRLRQAARQALIEGVRG